MTAIVNISIPFDFTSPIFYLTFTRECRKKRIVAKTD